MTFTVIAFMFSLLESLYYITVCIFTQTCQCNFNLIWFSSLTLLAAVQKRGHLQPQKPGFSIMRRNYHCLQVFFRSVCVFVFRLCCSMAPSLRKTRMDPWALEITGLTPSSSWYSALSLLTWENKQHLLATELEVSVSALLFWWCL